MLSIRPVRQTGLIHVERLRDRDRQRYGLRKEGSSAHLWRFDFLEQQSFRQLVGRCTGTAARNLSGNSLWLPEKCKRKPLDRGVFFLQHLIFKTDMACYSPWRGRLRWLAPPPGTSPPVQLPQIQRFNQRRVIIFRRIDARAHSVRRHRRFCAGFN